MVIADTLARRLAAQGVAVGVLAVDEDPEDRTIRLLQIAGFTIAQAELRDVEDLARMRAALEPLGLRLYGATWTIDAAADDLATHAAATRQRATLDRATGVTAFPSRRSCDEQPARPKPPAAGGTGSSCVVLEEE